MRKKIIILLTLALALSACLPNQNTVDVQPQINTAVAQTMQAEHEIANIVAQTLTAQQPLASPTTVLPATNEPTLELVVIPTDTPLPLLPTFTNVPPPQPQNVQPSPQPYGCYVTTLRPAAYEEIKAGTNFEIVWSVKNTGTRTWDYGFDIKFASGTSMSTATRAQISRGLAPGESFKVSINAKAPKNTGVKQMTWIVEGALCYANVIITVK